MVDLEAARERGIVVSNVRNYSKYSVAEHTFALMLALRRSLISYYASITAGRWQQAQQFCYFDYPIADLGGGTLGILGGGNAGTKVARIGEAFGMTALIAGRKNSNDLPIGRTPFYDVIEQSDVIWLHLRLVEETTNLIGATEFGLMKRSALLINTARDGLVDESELSKRSLRGRSPAPHSTLHHQNLRQQTVL